MKRENLRAGLVLEFAIVLILLAAGAAYAASDTPALQVTGYSTTPASVYPGTTGQLQLSLSNGGGDTATQIRISYDNAPGGGAGGVGVGDIPAGGTALATLPFSVPSGATSGILVIHMSIIYSDSSGLLGKSVPATVSIPILQHQVLSVSTLAVSSSAVQPGDKLSATLEIANTGGVTQNVVIRPAANSSFSLDGASEFAVGAIGFNSTREVSVNLLSASSASAGRYLIPLTVEYQDALQNTVSQTVYVGPVNVLDASTQFSLDISPLDDSEVGSAAAFQLTLRNMGGSGTAAMIDINSSSTLTPIGNSRIFFDYVGPGENQSKNITVGIDPTASAGYYDLPITVTANGRAYSQDLGVVVHASQEITLSSSTEPSVISAGSSVTVTAEIANSGNSAIRSVYASVRGGKNLTVAQTDKFIGTLNVDDFSTFQFTVSVPQSASSGTYGIPVKVTFKDSVNQEHTVEKDIAITVYSQGDALRMGASGNSTYSGGFAGKSAGGIFGIALLTPVNIGIGVILLVVGYFGYKKLRAGK